MNPEPDPAFEEMLKLEELARRRPCGWSPEEWAAWAAMESAGDLPVGEDP